MLAAKGIKFPDKFSHYHENIPISWLPLEFF